MNARPLCIDDPKNPGTTLLSPAAVLLMAADAAVAPDTPAVARRNGQAISNALLDAAQAKGFTQRDIFLTLAAQRMPSQRLREMAQAAVDNLTAAELKHCLQSITLAKTEGNQS